MEQRAIGEAWAALCEKHDKARDEYFSVYREVTDKFAKVALRTSSTNPTLDECGDFEAKWNEWDSIKREMDAFIATVGRK